MPAVRGGGVAAVAPTRRATHHAGQPRGRAGAVAHRPGDRRGVSARSCTAAASCLTSQPCPGSLVNTFTRSRGSLGNPSRGVEPGDGPIASGSFVTVGRGASGGPCPRGRRPGRERLGRAVRRLRATHHQEHPREGTRLPRTRDQGMGRGPRPRDPAADRRDRSHRHDDDLRDGPAHPQGRRPRGHRRPHPRPRGRGNGHPGRIGRQRHRRRATGSSSRASAPAGPVPTASRTCRRTAWPARARPGSAGSSVTSSTAPRPSTCGPRSPTTRCTSFPAGSATRPA